MNHALKFVLSIVATSMVGGASLRATPLATRRLAQLVLAATQQRLRETLDRAEDRSSRERLRETSTQRSPLSQEELAEVRERILQAAPNL